MANEEFPQPDYGICYCLHGSILKEAADGTVYCASPTAHFTDEMEREERNCRDSAGNAVRGPKLAQDSNVEEAGRASKPPRVSFHHMFPVFASMPRQSFGTLLLIRCASSWGLLSRILLRRLFHAEGGRWS